MVYCPYTRFGLLLICTYARALTRSHSDIFPLYMNRHLLSGGSLKVRMKIRHYNSQLIFLCPLVKKDVFSPNYKLTIGVDFSLKTIEWDPKTRVNLQLW